MALTRAFSFLMLVTLLLSTSTPLQAARVGAPMPAPVQICAPLSDVTEWIANFEFSWTDAAEGEVFGVPGRASIHRQAMTSQHLTRYSDLTDSERWSAEREAAQLSGLVNVDDQVNSDDGSVHFSTSGNGSPNQDNFNLAILEVFPDCTYDLQFGFDGDVINQQGPNQFDGTLLLGDVFLRGLPVPTELFDVTLSGSTTLPYDSSANSSNVSSFSAGFDNGFNEIRSIRGGDSVANAHVAWTLVPGNRLPCGQRRTAIDAGDPNLQDMRLTIDSDPPQIPPNQGNSLTPPDPAKVTILATCGLTPIRNARIKVGVEAKKNSGGHLHNNGARPRPRGFLRDAGSANYTEITAAHPTITVQTDANGKAVVYFRPGVDYDAGGAAACSGEQRGISGLYEITATPTATRFAAKEAKQAVMVKRSDFTPVAGGNLIDVINGSRHPQGTSGTAQTIAALNALATDFNNAQVANNVARGLAALDPWRIVKLPVVDASLQDGGLYETQGIDVCQTGQPSVPFRDWQIPHQTHMVGTAADIKTSLWANPSDPENNRQYAWWRNTLRALGCNYGTWARERVSFHLDVNQNSATYGQFHSGCQYTPDPTVQSGLDSAVPVTLPQANQPDLFVTLVPDAPEEDVRLAPGQSITYSIGLSNLYGDAIAHGATVTATLPAGLQFVSSDPPGVQTGNVMVWPAGDLAAHALPALYFFSVQADLALAPQTLLTLTVTTAGSDIEHTTENNADRAGLLVRALGPDLLVDSNLDSVGMTLDRPVTVTLAAINQGNADAPDTKLRLNLPPATVVIRSVLTPALSGPNFVEWNLGTLAADTTQPLTVAVGLDAELAQRLPASDQVTNPVTLTFATTIDTPATDSDPSNNDATYVREATLGGQDLQLWLQVAGTNEGVIESGQTLTYTLLYGNFGAQIAYTPTVEFTLGEGLSLVSATPPANGSGTYTWTTAALAVGEVQVIQARVHVDAIPAQGSQVAARLYAANPDSNILNNRAEDARFTALSSGGTILLPLIRRE